MVVIITIILILLNIDSTTSNSILYYLRAESTATIIIIIMGRAIAQAVSRWLPTAAARVQTTKWRWGRFSPSTSVSPANLHSRNFSTITVTYHPGLVQYASSGRSTQSPTAQIKKNKIIIRATVKNQARVKLKVVLVH
jgi:hypothetical protein